MIQISLTAMPVSLLKVDVPTFKTVGETSVPDGTQKADAPYVWVLSKDSNISEGVQYIPGDARQFDPFSVRPSQDESHEPGPPVAYLCKIDPRTGDIKYGGPESPVPVDALWLLALSKLVV